MFREINDYSKKKILIVDDIPKNIQVLAQNLEVLGSRLAFATNGKNALQLINKDKFDLILLDISMPELDGLEVCRRIKSIPANKEVPVIFITAFDDAESITEGFRAGAVDYITKPFNSDELLARARTHLRLKSSIDQMKRINDVLEEKVEIRTKELSTANKKLQVLEKTKGDFLALISHELRTPLIGIKGFAEILDETVDEENREYVSYVMESANRLMSFSEAALLITSLQSQKEDLVFEKSDVKRVLSEVIEKFRKRLIKSNLTVDCNCDDNSLMVKVDEGLIAKSFENILDNAIKFSPENGVIKINLLSDGDSITVQFSDDGPGFDDIARNELFDFFSSEDVMHHSSGFGLGLAAVKLIMDAHDGSIEIENKKEETGAVVRLVLPMLEEFMLVSK